MAKLIPSHVDSNIASSETTFLNALSQYTPEHWIAYHNFNFLELDSSGIHFAPGISKKSILI